MQPIGIASLPVHMNTAPADCALVIALPLDRRRFLHDLIEGPPGNFARSYQRETASENDPSSDAAWLAFEPFADHAHRVISEAAKLGVHVVSQATLEHFLDVLPRFKATTLFAHYRSALFLPEDIPDARKVLLDLQANGSFFPDNVVDLVSADAAALAALLNDVIAPERNGPAMPKKPGQITKEHMDWHERRKRLEHLFPGDFRGGSAVEFVDGWHCVDTIEEGISIDYSGVLDLTVCNSTVLAEKIRRKCPHSVPISNEQEASLHFRFAVYRLVLRDLKENPRPYEDAAFAIRHKLCPQK